MEGISFVTIKEKLPLYKGEEEALRIEVIHFNESGFQVVAQKGLYKIGDKALYIQPDYCVPDNEYFKEFVRPGGEISKSYLGKIAGVPSRIRAKKFNFSVIKNGQSVYSNGILLPLNVVKEWFGNKAQDLEYLKEQLGVYKYVEPEETTLNNYNRPFPSGVYKTDENNFNNISHEITFPCTLYGTEKIDGSSITLGVINGELIICSRNLQKEIYIKKLVGKRSKTLLEKLFFWKKHDLNVYETVENDDIFVKEGMKILRAVKEFNPNINNFLLRGELNGGGCKGSGNKYNPSSKLPTNIKLFGLDLYVGGIAVRESQENFFNFCCTYGLDTVKLVFCKEFKSSSDVIGECNRYFIENMIEGIVIRDEYNTISAKVMNQEYDSKK